MSIHLFQILSQEQQAAAGCVGLHADVQPGWGAYRTIKEFFLDNVLDDDALYGFLPASFVTDTGMHAAYIRAFVQENPGRDTYTFYPFYNDAYFLNVFEQGDYAFHGLQGIAQEYLNQIGLELDLASWVIDANVQVRIQYIVAKPVFWQTWFDLAEKVCAIAEDATNPLAAKLNTVVPGTRLEIKWLLVERLAALVLDLDQALTLVSYDGLSLPVEQGLSNESKTNLRAANALKHSYRQTGEHVYLNRFYVLRNVLLSQLEATSKPPVFDMATIDQIEAAAS